MIARKITAFILFSSIFIATCAVALCFETNLLLQLPPNSISFYCFVFGATLAQYNLHYLIKTTAIRNSARLEWSMNNKNLHRILFGIGIGLILFSFFSFRLHHFIILAILGGVAFLYSFPLLPSGKKKRIKDYGLLKIVTLALLWTLVTVWFPVVNYSIEPPTFIFVFLERFIFMFLLCLLFDMRDIEIDGRENIKTLAVILGKKKSYELSFGITGIFILVSVLHYWYNGNPGIFAAMVLSAFFTLLAINYTKKSNTDYVYLAGVDGMMLVQALLVYVLGLKF